MKNAVWITFVLACVAATRGYHHTRAKRQDFIFPGDYNSDSCTLPRGKPGTCAPLSTCSEVLEDNVLPRICEHAFGDPIVCCPLKSPTQPTFQQNQDCGRASPQHTADVSFGGRRKRQADEVVVEQEGQVVGGEDSVLNEWPWMAAIGRGQDNRPPKWICGGSLINDRYVLTAAHCLLEQPNLVRLGDLDITRNNDSAKPVDIEVKETTRHPLFKYPELYYDIGLIRLRQPVRISVAIRPVCLPSPRFGDLNEKEVVLTGWGTTYLFGDSSDILQKVTLNVVPLPVCYNQYLDVPLTRLNFPDSIKDHQMCAGARGKDACHGDSGGPLIYRDPSTFRWNVVGVVAGGAGCGFEQFSGVYTRVDKFLDWIGDNIKP